MFPWTNGFLGIENFHIFKKQRRLTGKIEFPD